MVRRKSLLDDFFLEDLHESFELRDPCLPLRGLGLVLRRPRHRFRAPPLGGHQVRLEGLNRVVHCLAFRFDALFRRAPQATTRVLRPATLYAAIPAATFDGVAARLPALRRS